MKTYLQILFLLISYNSFSCSCDDINPIMEFKLSEYVFEGKIISKVYSDDKKTYKVIFEISKHYKLGDNPTNLEFELNSEGKYTNVYSSCDWSADLNQKWLVYVKKVNGSLIFDAVCSNTKRIDKYYINKNELNKITHGNTFKFDNYIINENEHGFNYCKNITDINSILKNGRKKDYKNPYTLLIIKVNKKGKLKNVFISKNLQKKGDTIFNLVTELIDTKKNTLSEFEKEAVKLVSKIKAWEIKRFTKTNEAVNYIRHIWVEFDPKTQEWKYEL